MDSIETLIQQFKSETFVKDQGVLEEVKEKIKKYVVLESEVYYDAVTLWIAYTYLQKEFEIFPRLVITSPDKQCGKTLLLELVELLCENTNASSNISEASLFRIIDSTEEIVLFIDEYDRTFSKDANKEKAVALTQIFNAGFRVTGKVQRCEAKSFVVKTFYVACPVAMAGIGKGNAPDTIRDRSLLIPMRRITKHESSHLHRFRVSKADKEFAPVRERLRNATKARAKEIAQAIDAVEFPQGLSGRQEDIWENLLAVALVFGGEWNDRARASAVALCDPDLEPITQNYKVETLSLCRDVFDEISENRISASDLVLKINNLEHSPYKDSALSFNAKRLATHLEEFGIKSHRPSGKVREYFREHFEKAWASYLVEPVTSVKPVNEEEPDTFDTLDGL